MKSEIEQLGLNQRIEKFCTNLPSKNLEKYITTPDLKNKFHQEKHKAILLGKLLKARFGGGGGNPAKEAFNTGKIDNNTYHNLMAVLNRYASLFALYQTAWVELEMVFTSCIDCPKSEIDLFLETLREDFDSNFLRAVNNGSYSLKEGVTIGKLITDVNKRGQCNRDWDFKLTPEEQYRLPNSYKNKSKTSVSSWKITALAICEEAAKNDIPIRKALRRYINDASHIFGLIGRACYAETRNNPPRLLQSEKWEDGIKKVRTAKGFKSTI